MMRILIHRSLGIAFLLAVATVNARAGELEGRVMVGGRPVRDAVVFIEDLRAAPAEKSVVLDQHNRTFIPHVMVVQVGTRVEFPNHDTVYHNVFSYRDGKKFDLGLYPVGSTKVRRFDQPGLIRLFCNIHSNMSAFIWVVDNPYFTKTDKAGRFRITGVPSGQRSVQIWHERWGKRRLTAEVPREGTASLSVTLDPR
jgi:plastocyanin